MKTAALSTVHATLLALAFTGCVGADREATRPIAVQTSSGQVLAERVTEGALVYRDIPFAKPPIGPLRWAAPEPLENP